MNDGLMGVIRNKWAVPMSRGEKGDRIYRGKTGESESRKSEGSEKGLGQCNALRDLWVSQNFHVG